MPEGLGAAGVAGCAAGGGVVGAVALPVVAAGGLLAVLLLLLFQPAIRMIAINTTTAMPATQPHMPPAESGRRATGSLRRGSLRGSLMIVLLGSEHCLEPRQPIARVAVPGRIPWNILFQRRKRCHSAIGAALPRDS